MPSIGSEIANLSIANGSGASAAGQLASLGEQPAVRAGANADSEGSGPHSDGQPSSATSGAHRSGGGGSPAAQHGSEAVSLMQRQLAQLRLEGGGRAAPEHPQPEGKRLRRAASPAAGAPAPPGRPAAMKQVRGKGLKFQGRLRLSFWRLCLQQHQTAQCSSHTVCNAGRRLLVTMVQQQSPRPRAQVGASRHRALPGPNSHTSHWACLAMRCPPPSGGSYRLRLRCASWI